ESRTTIRPQRRDSNDKLKKMLKDHQIAEDDERHALDEIQKMTDKHIDEVGSVLKSKEVDIMAVCGGRGAGPRHHPGSRKRDAIRRRRAEAVPAARRQAARAARG